uniref:Uncharacterized protein n=1 Tax=mine drainage metagenome TaxID=410659 RepID=E6PKF1_9ZZZZ
MLGGDRATGGLNRNFCTTGNQDASNREIASNLARCKNFCSNHLIGNKARGLQAQQINLIALHQGKFGQTNFGLEFSGRRFETTLWQATLQGHLTAFEANFVVATGT